MKWYEDKEYQEMCEGAEKIQQGWKPKEGDWFYAKEWSKVCIWSRCTSFYKHYVWLPSQEDLREMLKDKGPEDWLLGTLESWTNETYLDHWKPWHFFRSMTKIWLAFVMHELYQKNWNPETKKWEKIEK